MKIYIFRTAISFILVITSLLIFFQSDAVWRLSIAINIFALLNFFIDVIEFLDRYKYKRSIRNAVQIQKYLKANYFQALKKAGVHWGDDPSELTLMKIYELSNSNFVEMFLEARGLFELRDSLLMFKKIFKPKYINF